MLPEGRSVKRTRNIMQTFIQSYIPDKKNVSLVMCFPETDHYLYSRTDQVIRSRNFDVGNS